MPGESGDKLTSSDCPQTYVKKKIIRQYCYNNFHKQFYLNYAVFMTFHFDISIRRNAALNNRNMFGNSYFFNWGLLEV